MLQINDFTFNTTNYFVNYLSNWDYTVENISQVQLINYSLTSSLIFSAIGVGVLVWSLTLGVWLFKSSSTIMSSLTIYNYLQDVEKEVGSFDDFFLYLLIFISLISNYYFYTLFFINYSNAFTCIILLTSIVILTGVLIPSFTLKHYGVAMFNYIRGVGRSTSLIIENFFDLLAVTSIFLRFLIQNIRFVLIFLAFFELYEFTTTTLNLYTSWTFSTLFNENYYILFKHKNFSILGYIIPSLITLITYFYYVGHLTVLFITQLAIYFALSFWLFFFLYTTFLLETTEKYFFYKKIN